MIKLKELMDKTEKKEYQICKYTGLKGRSDSLEKVFSGERELTSLNLNLLSAYARGLGVKLTDILDEYELDGTTSQIVGIKRLVERIRKVNENNVEYREDFSNGGFVIGINLQKAVSDFPLKKDYEFIKPNKSHDFNTPDISMLNREFNNKVLDHYSTRNKTALNVSPRYNSHALSFIIYSPFEHGGDLKTAISTFDKNGDLLFSEIYGCEWLDKPDQKDIFYYKYEDYDNIITPARINSSKKEMISELEFFKGFYSQLYKFKLIYC